MASRTSLFIVYRAPDAPNRISHKPKSVAGKESAQMVTPVPVVTDAPRELSRKNRPKAMKIIRRFHRLRRHEKRHCDRYAAGIGDQTYTPRSVCHLCNLCNLWIILITSFAGCRVAETRPTHPRD